MPSVRSLLSTSALATTILLVCAGCGSSAGDEVAAAREAAPQVIPAVPAGPAAGDSARPLIVVTIGDSIMAGYGLDPEDAWPTLVAHSTDANVVNLGCSGAGFVAVGDCGTDFAGLIGLAAAAHPDLVIVQSSDNDLDQDEDTLDDATAATITALHDAVPAARIIGVNTLWSLSEDEPDSIEWSTEALRSAVSAVGGEFVSIGQPLRGEDDLLQWDDEHPSEDGQMVLRDVILATFAAAGISL